jgi:hypothetical protein
MPTASIGTTNTIAASSTARHSARTMPGKSIRKKRPSRARPRSDWR